MSCSLNQLFIINKYLLFTSWMVLAAYPSSVSQFCKLMEYVRVVDFTIWIWLIAGRNLAYLNMP